MFDYCYDSFDWFIKLYLIYFTVQKSCNISYYQLQIFEGYQNKIT